MALFLLSARHSAFFVMVPGFSMRSMPVLVRIALAVGISVAIIPPGSAALSVVAADHTFFLALGKEILVGGLAGFGVMLVFAGFQAAGALVGMQLGLGLPAILNPQFQAQDTTLESFNNLVAIFVFLAINAHHSVLAALAGLNQAIPIDSFVLAAPSRNALVDLGGQFFATALRVAFPVMAAMLLADVALGLVARLSPQIQAFFIGIPAKVGLGMLVLVLTFPGMVAMMAGGFDSGLRDALRLVAGG